MDGHQPQAAVASRLHRIAGPRATAGSRPTGLTLIAPSPLMQLSSLRARCVCTRCLTLPPPEAVRGAPPPANGRWRCGGVRADAMQATRTPPQSGWNMAAGGDPMRRPTYLRDDLDTGPVGGCDQRVLLHPEQSMSLQPRARARSARCRRQGHPLQTRACCTCIRDDAGIVSALDSGRGEGQRGLCPVSITSQWRAAKQNSSAQQTSSALHPSKTQTWHGLRCGHKGQ